MVRCSLATCFFCDEYRAGWGCGFTACLMADDNDEFVEPDRKMVKELFDGDVSSHAETNEHMARMSGVLRNPAECDRVLRQTRPTPIEREHQQRCMDELKKTLRPQAMHWTGSVGKSTALQGSHDLDVCVKFGSGTKGSQALAEIESRLRGSAFVVVRKEASLVFARYGDLELDIIPEASEGQHDKWKAQVDHLEYFGQMSPTSKDVVRLIKAWARLRIPMPGVLIEVMVDEVYRNEQQAKGSATQNLFLSCLRELSRQRSWIDPLNTQNDLRYVLQPHEWDELHTYASSTISLLHVSGLEMNGVRFATYPERCEMELVFNENSKRSPLAMGMLNGFEIAELCIRLAMPVPSRFEQYRKSRSLAKLSGAQKELSSDFVQKFVGADFVERACADVCKQLEHQIMALGMDSTCVEVKETFTQLVRLVVAAESCADVRPDALRVVRCNVQSMLTRIRQHDERQRASTAWTTSPCLDPATTLCTVIAVIVALLAFLLNNGV